MATLTFISKSIDNYNYGEWLCSSLKFQHLLLKHAAGSVNGTIKIIGCTSPINKACLQLGGAIRLILIMEKPLFLHCSPFAPFIPGSSHILWVWFHVGLGSQCFIGHWRGRTDSKVNVKVTARGTEDGHCQIWYVSWLNKLLFFINTTARSAWLLVGFFNNSNIIHLRTGFQK